MATYWQWRRAVSRKGTPRVTWVCGSERVLVSEVVDGVGSAVMPDQTERYVAGTVPAREIWAAALAVPPGTERRLIVVSEAQKLGKWDNLHLAARIPGTWIVLESSEDDFPRKDGKLVPPATWLRDSTLGQLVRCGELTEPDAVAWVQLRLPQASSDTAVQLLRRAAGNLAEVRDVARMAHLFGGPITGEAINALCSELPHSFADMLVLGDRDGALLAADEQSPDDFGRSIGMLSYQLDMLALLHRAANENISRRDVTAKLGVPAFLAQQLAGVAREYGEERVARCRRALAVADCAWRAGASVGVAEVLVASW